MKRKKGFITERVCILSLEEEEKGLAEQVCILSLEKEEEESHHMVLCPIPQSNVGGISSTNFIHRGVGTDHRRLHSANCCNAWSCQ
jgi:hypothetical protein